MLSHNLVMNNFASSPCLFWLMVVHDGTLYSSGFNLGNTVGSRLCFTGEVFHLFPLGILEYLQDEQLS